MTVLSSESVKVEVQWNHHLWPDLDINKVRQQPGILRFRTDGPQRLADANGLDYRWTYQKAEDPDTVTYQSLVATVEVYPDTINPVDVFCDALHEAFNGVVEVIDWSAW